MSARSIVRKGFTLVELLVVITIILLISTLFLGLTPGDGGGLPAGQRFIASSIRTVRAMALMNRGPGNTGVSYCGRYRLLILNLRKLLTSRTCIHVSETRLIVPTDAALQHAHTTSHRSSSKPAFACTALRIEDIPSSPSPFQHLRLVNAPLTRRASAIAVMPSAV